MRTWLAQLAHDAIVMLGGQLERLRRTPRWDSPRRVDRARLFLMRTRRRLWRKVPGVAAYQRRRAVESTVYVELLTKIDGQWADRGREVIPFGVDRDTLDLGSTTLLGQQRVVSVRVFSLDPQEHGYPGSRWKVPGAPVPVYPEDRDVLAKRARPGRRIPIRWSEPRPEFL